MLLPIKVWRRQSGKYFFISTGIRGANGKIEKDSFRDHCFARDEFDTLVDFIMEHKDEEVYFCPHGFEGKSRTKAFAVAPRLLYADLDSVDPRKIEDIPPTIAWESSPKRFAAIWQLTDGFFTEDLNKRLTYYLGADNGGWDLTQLLRVPGTYNHKYKDAPEVKMLWASGERYKIEDIERAVGRSKGGGQVARDLYSTWEKRLPHWVRRELFTKTPIKPGKRSEVLWRLNRELIEVGMSSDDALELLKLSPWNKFANRANGDEQLRREIAKSVSDQVPRGGEQRRDDDPMAFKFAPTSMDNVVEEDVDWIWEGIIARGFVTILEGDPGLGKSYLAMMIAAGICDGHKMPGMKKPLGRGKVLYFDMENSASHVTKRRLVDNGTKNLGSYFQEERPFSIDDDDAMVSVLEGIEKIKPDLVVFDTINIYIGGADTHKASEAAQALAPFVQMARDNNCAVLLLRHLTKNTKTSPLYRGQGSIAFTGGARIVLICGKIPGEAHLRGTAQIKNNLGKQMEGILTWSIDSVPSFSRPDKSAFTWGEVLPMTALEMLTPAADGEEAKDDKDEIVNFLTGILEEGPIEASALKRAATARSLSWKKVEKHLDSAGVVAREEMFKHRPRTMYMID